jgi:hypothetical protein
MSLPRRSDLTPAIEQARKTLDDFDREPRIRANVRAHYENLVQLAENLKRLGLEEELIEASVLDVFHEYELELMRYIAIQSEAMAQRASS